MALKFGGTKSQFISLIEELGAAGAWSEDKAVHRFHADDGTVVSFFSSTGTVQIQGKQGAKLADAIESILGRKSTPLDFG